MATALRQWMLLVPCLICMAAPASRKVLRKVLRQVMQQGKKLLRPIGEPGAVAEDSAIAAIAAAASETSKIQAETKKIEAETAKHLQVRRRPEVRIRLLPKLVWVVLMLRY